MQSENQKAALEQIKQEAKEKREMAYKALLILSKEKIDGFVSTTEISCFLYPKSSYETKISTEGKSYMQNSQASTVMSWLKRLETEGKVESKLISRKRVYKPTHSVATLE